MNMVNVPNEVWTQIFRHLRKPDLKALRLSGNHYLRSLASSLLFTTAYVAARKAVLNTFVALTTHPEYSKYIKEVVYDSSYISAVVLEQNRNTKCGSALATLFGEQEIIHGGELQKSLDQAFESLSNVSRVRYADMSRIAFLPGDCDVSTWERNDYQDEPLMYRIGSECLRSCGASLVTRHKMTCRDHKDNNEKHMKFEGFVALMQTLANSTATDLLDLSLGQRIHAAGSGGISSWFFSPVNAETTHPFLYPAFVSLRKLDLAISSDLPANIQHEMRCNLRATVADHIFETVNLASLLTSAQNLQEVKLAGECRTYSLRFANTFSNHAWSKLRTVTLEYFEGSQEELEEFLIRHSTTLRYMCINYFTLTSGSWRTLGAILPIVAPDLEFIFGMLYVGNQPYHLERLLPLASEHFDKSGLEINRRKNELSGEGEGDYETEDEEEDEDEDEDGDENVVFHKDRLVYSSDDSTPSTASNPRRKPDLDLLSKLTPSMREKVEYIRAALPGCPVEKSRDVLIKTDGSCEAAIPILFTWFGYTELECLGPEKKALAERLIKESPSDADENECIQRLKDAAWDYGTAKWFLLEHHRSWWLHEDQIDHGEG